MLENCNVDSKDQWSKETRVEYWYSDNCLDVLYDYPIPSRECENYFDRGAPEHQKCHDSWWLCCGVTDNNPKMCMMCYEWYDHDSWVFLRFLA